MVEAWATAQNIAGKVQSKNDALNVISSNGIDHGLLGKINGYLNNPIAGLIASAAGVDLNGVKRMMSDLSGGGSAAAPDHQLTSINSNDNISKFRAGLQQLKR